jgi:hypothetical protein
MTLTERRLVLKEWAVAEELVETEIWSRWALIRRLSGFQVSHTGSVAL